MSDVKSRRAEYAGLTRDAVLVAARDLFVRDGFDSTSVDDIARVSRVSKGAVYHHFSDKQGLFAAVFRSSQEAVLGTVAQAAGAKTQPWDQAEAAARAFLGCYVDDPDARALLRQSTSVLGQQLAHSIDEELALPLLIGLLAELRQRAELRDVSIDTAARILFGTLCEAATFVAGAANGEAASAEAERVVLCMMEGLRST